MVNLIPNRHLIAFNFTVNRLHSTFKKHPNQSSKISNVNMYLIDLNDRLYILTALLNQVFDCVFSFLIQTLSLCKINTKQQACYELLSVVICQNLVKIINS